MAKNTWCVIMAGGGGTRFWPISTVNVPKQFLKIMGTDQTFLQCTAGRFKDLVPPERMLVVTTRKYASKVREQLPLLPEENILKEPFIRDTAACVAYAMFTILKRDPEGLMVVVPSDHIILEPEKFSALLKRITDELHQYDALATIGITPTRPDTNYGYIQVEGNPEEGKPIKVKTFTEKPDKKLAEVFCNSGDFLWNSGIFIWKAETIRREFERYMPQIVSEFNGWENAIGTEAEPDFLDGVYSDLPKISIDYAIMERTDNAWTMPASFGWYDIGTFDSLFSSFTNKDKNGNCPRGTQSVTVNSHNNLLLSANREKLIALSGIDDYLVIDTDKVLLICPRNDKKIRELTAELGAKGMEGYK